jgi:hypothetical protein
MDCMAPPQKKTARQAPLMQSRAPPPRRGTALGHKWLQSPPACPSALPRHTCQATLMGGKGNVANEGGKCSTPLLRLIAPQGHRGHRAICGKHVPQLQPPAAATVVDNLGDGIAQAAGAHVMDALYGVGRPQCCARVNHLLAPAR